MTADMGSRTDETKPPTRRRLSPELRRAQILDAARVAVAGRDPDDVTFEEIAGAAGVSRALVYNYFGDKGGLLAELYVTTLSDLDNETLRILREHPPDRHRLRAIISNYAAYARSHADSWNLVTCAAATTHPAISNARLNRLRNLGEAWGAPTAAAHLTGSAVFVFLEASVHEWDDLTNVNLDHAVDIIDDLLWNGLGNATASVDHPRATDPAA